MASFTERIRLLFDVDSSGAKTGFGDFGKSVRDAEGLWGKAKAGASSLGSTIKDNMGAAAIAGGAALVAFGVKAVGAFTDTAKAAIDMGKATGLSTEQASRWIAIGDDMGVSAEALTNGVGKIAKTLDSGAWEKYGIATRDASGEARSANDVLLDAFDKLGSVTNETERARIGNELFGKGYANLAPMIGKTRSELEAYLGSVESGQVITAKEAEKAEKMRLAMDHLHDALNEVTLAFGSAVSSISPMIDRTAGLIEKVTELENRFQVLNKVGWTTDPISAWDSAMSAATDSGQEFANMTRDELVANLKKYSDGAEFSGDAIAQWAEKNRASAEDVKALREEVGLSTSPWTVMQSAIDSVAGSLDGLKAKHDATTAALERQTKASWDLYNAQLALASGVIDLSSAQQSYMGALDALNTTHDDATTLVNEHVVALNDAEQASLRVAAAAADHAEQQAKLSGKTYEARDAALVQIDALKNLAAGLAPGSELRLFLEQTISSLDHTAQSGRDLADNLQAFVRSGGQVSTRR